MDTIMEYTENIEIQNNLYEVYNIMWQYYNDLYNNPFYFSEINFLELLPVDPDKLHDNFMDLLVQIVPENIELTNISQYLSFFNSLYENWILDYYSHKSVGALLDILCTSKQLKDFNGLIYQFLLIYWMQFLRGLYNV